jgi:hypothetical protein
MKGVLFVAKNLYALGGNKTLDGGREKVQGSSPAQIRAGRC